MSQTIRQPFVKVPHQLQEDARLSPTAIAVWAALKRHSRQRADRKCWPERKTLARLSHCEESAVDRAIQRLERAGWIKRKRSGRRTRYGGNLMYYFVFDSPQNSEGAESAKDRLRDERLSRQNTDSRSRQNTDLPGEVSRRNARRRRGSQEGEVEAPSKEMKASPSEKPSRSAGQNATTSLGEPKEAPKGDAGDWALVRKAYDDVVAFEARADILDELVMESAYYEVSGGRSLSHEEYLALKPKIDAVAKTNREKYIDKARAELRAQRPLAVRECCNDEYQPSASVKRLLARPGVLEARLLEWEGTTDSKGEGGSDAKVLRDDLRAVRDEERADLQLGAGR